MNPINAALLGASAFGLAAHASQPFSAGEARVSQDLPVETPGAPGAASGAVHQAIGALRAAAGADMTLVGKIESIAPPGNEDILAFVSQAGDSMGMNGFMGIPGFIGPIYVHRTAAGEMLIVSQDVAPGFVIYSSGGKVFKRTTVAGDQHLDIRQVGGDLRHVADLTSLMKAIDLDTLSAVAGGLEGAASFEGELRRSALTKNDDPTLMTCARVQRIVSRVDVGREHGELRGLRLDVERSDPTAQWSTVVFDEVTVPVADHPVADHPVTEHSVEGHVVDGQAVDGIAMEFSDVIFGGNPMGGEWPVGFTTRIRLETLGGAAMPARVQQSLAEMRAVKASMGEALARPR